MRKFFAYAFSLIGGLIAGWVDMHNDEPQSAVLVVLVFATIMGFAIPRGAWRWGLITGSGIFFAYAIAAALGAHLAQWPQPNNFATLLGLVPGMFGAYFGVLIRKVKTMSSQKSKSGTIPNS